MRLLQFSESGQLSIHTFDDGAIPAYAILSHTWGADRDEVTFADLDTVDGRTKPGYEKIRFCGEQARHDGLQHFWIDTCCINKNNQAELAFAIRSMFRWYRNAARCYVYLSDVSTRKRSACSRPIELSWEPAFRSSRWFMRGWTLQELLAPSIVEFFSQEGKKLGNKILLQTMIHEITSIPLKALNGVPLSQFSVNERLWWKEGRETKREEDVWYSLSGIFDVEIGPAYSEGAASAFKRLMDEIHKLERCVQDIRSTDPHDDKKRIEETKGGLLADSYRWVLDNTTFQQWQQEPHSRLLWVKSDPGKGKTMLLCGIIDELYNAMPKTALLSYFFCQESDSRINNATAVLRGLLYMLVSQQPSLISHVRKKHDHAGKALFEGPNAWVALRDIFVDVLRDPNLGTTYLIVDALDECATDRTKLLEFVTQQSSTSDSVKWIVSSRNWPDIEAQLDRAGHKVKLSLELNAKSVATAVDIFIQRKVDQLAQQKQYKSETREAVLQHLRSNAHDTFLWVALVCQDLKATASRHVLKKLASFPPGLDALYKRMIDQISKSDDAETCRCVLATSAVLYRPVTILELIALVEQLGELVDDLESVREIISLCGSFLTQREGTVYFVHQSAKDFLLATTLDKIFPDGTEDVHRVIFSKSLAVLSSTLHRDMYGLKELGCPIENAQPADLDLLAASRYSCVYWIDHLCDSKPASWANSSSGLQVAGVVDVFLKKKYLYWLEGLSLCKSMGKGVILMAKLRLLVEVWNGDELLQHVQDAQRFIMYHKGVIESYPLQVYASALLFSPTKSLIRRLFQHEEPRGITVKPTMSDNWSASLQTLEGHSSGVSSVAFSHNSAHLASASVDNTIKIWDANSGACLQTLEGHSSGVNLVAFSHDSAHLASASGDKTVKIWDANSGACLHTLEGHSDYVRSVAFSHDSAHLASASRDKTVKIWDASSGACLQTLEGHSSGVNLVAFSHDSAHLASASVDKTVKIWDASSSACLHTLEGHGGWVRSVAFSHDSTRLVSASDDRTVKIWDASSGACLHTLEGHGGSVMSVAFSHDSAHLASASRDNTVKIWDASSGAFLHTLEGHSNGVSSVAFSHNSAHLASASFDKTAKIWDANSGASLHTLEGHSDCVRSVAFSHDLAHLASASRDKTVKIWDASSGAFLHTLEGHSNRVRSVAFSHDLAHLASASRDKTVKIWDASSGAFLHTLEGHSSGVNSVAFSHNSAHLASASVDKTVKIWDASSGACLHTLEGHSDGVSSVAFSHNSAHLASGSGDNTVKIWDTNSGACLQTLKGHSSWVSSVAFSHNSARLASASGDKTVKMWDANSGACLQTLNIGKALFDLSFDPTSSYLYTEIGTLVARNSQVGISDVVEPKPPLYLGICVSLDSIWIKYAGKSMLWVPSEYRLSCSAVCGNTIGVGVGSGRVWSCSIDLDHE